MSARDRRALAFLAVAMILAALYQFWPSGDAPAGVDATPESVGAAEVNLVRLRRIAAKRDELISKEKARSDAERALAPAGADAGGVARRRRRLPE